MKILPYFAHFCLHFPACLPADRNVTSGEVRLAASCMSGDEYLGILSGKCFTCTSLGHMPTNDQNA